MYTKLNVNVEDDGRIRFSGPCIVTGREHSVVVSQEGALAYFERGLKAQDAFPELPKEEREFLISGASPEGFQMLLVDWHEEDEDAS
jgi:hypothetical protein